MEKEIEKYLNKKAAIGYLQILILLVGMFGFCYIFNEVYDSIEDEDESISNIIPDGGSGQVSESNSNPLSLKDTNTKTSSSSFKLLGRISNVKELFSGDMVASVDAAQAGDVCCEETRTGSTCQEAPPEQCNPDFAMSPTLCENTNFCDSGCCVSPTTGLCNKGTGKRDCERMDGLFDDDGLCNIEDCEMGCCILGENTLFTTEANCIYEGNTQGDILTEYRPEITSHIECAFLAESGKTGACVYESGDETKCVSTSLEDCVERTGSEVNFYPETLCSNPELNTTCLAQNYTNCVPGEEDVYWFDSCSNKEEIAEDCDYYRGDYCKKNDNGASCEDIKCYTSEGVKQEGESWCSYDGYIGDGKDPAGSRHVKHICHMGTERILPCADHRQEICVQEDATAADGSTFLQAACRPNQWRTCMDYNRENDGDAIEEKCNKNPDCWTKHIEMGGSFDFKVCLPNYPPGFDVGHEDIFNSDGSFNQAAYYQSTEADGVCSVASLDCETTWKCCLIFFVPVCSCIDNCDCHTSKYPREMNDFCTSLGDCGSYINFVGDATNSGHYLNGDKDVPSKLSNSEIEEFSKYADMEATPADPGSYEFIAETTGIDIGSLPEAGESNLGNRTLSGFEKELLEASGSYGSPLLLRMITKDQNGSDAKNYLIPSRSGLGMYSSSSYSKSGILAQIVPGDHRAPPDFSMIAALIAGLIAYLIMGIVAAMIAAILAFLIFGACWIEDHHVNFFCKPWEPPTGGDKCNVCNDINVPCTEYRCESLGQLCHLINKGSENELCVSKPANESLPEISPFNAAISDGYSYVDVTANGFKVANASDPSGCIEPYTPVNIGIKVDPFAKCRFGDSPELSYDEMANVFGPKGNYILPAHLTQLFFVSPEAYKNLFDLLGDRLENMEYEPGKSYNSDDFKEIFGLTDEEVEKLGKVDYFIKCRSASGKVNPIAYHIESCVNPGPDLTPPRISPLSFVHGGSNVMFGLNETNYTLYVNEPSWCKWSFQNENYENMENDLDCGNDIVDVFANHYDRRRRLFFCTTLLTRITEHDKYYFKCKDRSSNNNTMIEGYVVEINSSTSPLEITKTAPKTGETIISGVEPATVKLIVETEGGINSGESICSWDGGVMGGDRFLYDNVAGDSYHEYPINSIRGVKDINYTCEDVAGNIAYDTTRFTVKIDDRGPMILRIYYEGGLKVVTNEEATCKYGYKRSFNFENATQMGGNGIEHFTGWTLKTHYIQCEDGYGNKGNRLIAHPIG